MDLCVSYQIILSNSWMLGSDFHFESMCKLLDHMIQLLATRKLNLEKDLLGLSQSLGDVSLNRDKCSWSTPSYSQIQEIFCYSVYFLFRPLFRCQGRNPSNFSGQILENFRGQKFVLKLTDLYRSQMPWLYKISYIKMFAFKSLKACINN